jgi:hypothetical protein
MADPVPHDIRQLADERARARRSRDWATADRIKAELEAAGWRVVDAATLYSLERLAPSVVEVEGELRYGASTAVPSRLDEPAEVRTTVVLIAPAHAGLLPDAVAALRSGSPGAQLVVVANAPADDIASEIEGLPPGVEVVRLAARLGAAAAVNAGVRRAVGGVVIVLDPRVEAHGDLASALASVLDDSTVGVAGLRGLATADLIHFEPAPAESADVVAVDGLAMAFRRSDYIERGPLDEHFTLPDYLDVWWSLVLRDLRESEEADEPDEAGAAPRRAVAVDVPVSIRETDDPPSDERLAKKHRYRFLKRFATRRDLLPATE